LIENSVLRYLKTMLMTASITIKTLLNALPTRSGVYRFLDKDGGICDQNSYIGSDITEDGTEDKP
jgi:hypothetical protein